MPSTAPRIYYPRVAVLIQPVWEDFASLSGSPASSSIFTAPLSATWTSNPPDEADEASITIDWRQIPLDPRVIASARVAIYAADVTDPRVDLYHDNTGIIRFVGLLDEPSVSLDDSTQAVTLKCRDYSGRLISTPWPAAQSIRITGALSAIVRDVIKTSGVAGYDELVIDTPDGDASPSGDLGRKTWTPSGRTVWDVVNELARLKGLLAYFRLDTLVLAAPIDPSTHKQPIARFLYGENVERVSFVRNANPVARKAVRVRAHNTGRRTTLEATYPPPTKERVETIALALPYGNWTQAQLGVLAKRFWVATGTSEMRGSITTMDMRDTRESDAFDIIGLRAGDVINVRLHSENADAINGMSPDAVVRYLTAQGVPQHVASQLVATWIKAEQVATIYSVSHVVHAWNAEDGYRASIDFRTILIPE